MSEQLKLFSKNPKDDAPELTFLARNTWHDKGLPRKVMQSIVETPSPLVGSNLFMFPTSLDFLLADFKISSPWLPKNIEMEYTGAALDDLDLKVILVIVKIMEARKKPSPQILDELVDVLTKNDESFKSKSEDEKIKARAAIKEEWGNKEGAFFNLNQFREGSSLVDGRSGYGREAIMKSVEKMSKSILKITVHAPDPNNTYSVPTQFLKTVLIPGQSTAYVSLPPTILEFFHFPRSIVHVGLLVNSKLGIENKTKKNQKQNENQRTRLGIHSQLFVLLMTFARGRTWSIKESDILARSLHHLMLEQHKGNLSGEDTVVSKKHGTTVGDNKGLTKNSIYTTLSRQRKYINQFFEDLQACGGLIYQKTGGRGQVEYSFIIKKDFERVVQEKMVLESMEKEAEEKTS